MPERHAHPQRIRLLAAAVLCAAALSPAAPGRSAAAPPEAGRWSPIFNGRDLDGWTPKIRGHVHGEDPDGTFSVRDGAITVDYGRYREWGKAFGHLCHHRRLSHYRIRVEYRFTGDPVAGGPDWARFNSGIMLHSQAPETMRRDQSFPVSLEFQLLGRGNEVPTNGNLCTPGTVADVDGAPEPGCARTASRAEPIGRWILAEAEVHGSRLIRHFLDGRLVLAYTGARLDPEDVDAKALIDAQGHDRAEAGHVCLQSESSPVQFRKVEIQPLDPREESRHRP